MPNLTPPRIVLRLRILNLVVSEYVKAFGVINILDLNVIEKGILHKQILKDINVNYIDSNGFIVAQITISIDWDRHAINAFDEKKNSFNLDESKSILEQLDKATTLIINHTIKLRKEHNINDVRCSYVYKNEITKDPVQDKQADEYLGLIKSKTPVKLSDEFKRSMNFVIDKSNNSKQLVLISKNDKFIAYIPPKWIKKEDSFCCPLGTEPC